MVAALAAGACAAPAPSLPPNSSAQSASPVFSAADVAKTCEEIAAEWGASHAQRNTVEAVIAANREQNQAAGYIAAIVFPPALLATVHNAEEKERLVALQARRDTLIELARARSCPPL